ncbi:MAG: trigger factor [Pseudomonadota bacterium]
MSSVETLSALERRLNATIPQQQVSADVEIRLKRVGRTAKVAGFRPGKVPYKIVEQQYGPQVREEVVGDHLQRAFAEAAEANGLKVVGVPRFEVKTDLKADPVEFSATFEVYPEITLGDLSGKDVERVAFELSEADVENTIETLRKKRATYEKVDRAAQNEDKVVIDFNGVLNGEPFEGGQGKDFPVVLGGGRMLPDFENAIVGMKAGETKSFDMTFPENYHGKDVAGKQVTFTITAHSVEGPKLPELDAEFAKSLGVTDGDVEKLKAEIRENLQREVKRRLKTRNKDIAMEALGEIGELELPKALIEWEKQNLQQQAVEEMRARGMNIPQGMTLPADLFTERAEKRVKLGLILEELVRKHDLSAKPDQIKALVEEYAQSFEQPEQVVAWYYSEPARLQEVENLVLEDNVVAWVHGVAKVNDKTVEFVELMGNI